MHILTRLDSGMFTDISKILFYVRLEVIYNFELHLNCTIVTKYGK